MKKNRFSILLLMFFLCISEVHSAAIYYKSDEYGKMDSVSILDIEHIKTDLKITNDQGHVTLLSLKENSIWGFRNKWGEDYRILKANSSWRVVEYGEISVYSSRKLKISSPENPDISPDYQDTPYELNKYYCYSLLPTGEMVKYSRKRFLNSLEYDPTLRNRFLKILNEQPANLLLYIMKYNADLWEE